MKFRKHAKTPVRNIPRHTAQEEIPDIPMPVRKLKPVYEREAVPVRKHKVRFKKKRCAFIKENGERCKSYASGKGTLCIHHGGLRPAQGLDPIPFSQYSHGVNTVFDPAYHPLKFIELARDGMSDVEIAAEFGVALDTVIKWAADIKEFNTAYAIGKTMYEAHFLRVGSRNLLNDRFNTPLYKYITMNKLGYSDKVESKSFNTAVHGVLLIPSDVSVEEWERENIQADSEKKNDNIIDME